nr:MAG TPA: protein of unknown function DUF1905 [Caudoviricetes sp.]
MRKINEGARINGNVIDGLETEILLSGGSLMINVTNVCRALNIERGDRVRLKIKKLDKEE